MAEQTKKRYPHYYGNVVRVFFMVAALIMVFALPAIRTYLHIPTVFSVAAILGLTLAAGLTNPKVLWTAGLNSIISFVGFLIFETMAVTSYLSYSASNKFFITNMSLGFIFLLAVYFSVKSWRGLYLQRKEAYEGVPIEYPDEPEDF